MHGACPTELAGLCIDHKLQRG